MFLDTFLHFFFTPFLLSCRSATVLLAKKKVNKRLLFFFLLCFYSVFKSTFFLLVLLSFMWSNITFSFFLLYKPQKQSQKDTQEKLDPSFKPIFSKGLEQSPCFFILFVYLFSKTFWFVLPFFSDFILFFYSVFITLFFFTQFFLFFFYSFTSRILLFVIRFFIRFLFGFIYSFTSRIFTQNLLKKNLLRLKSYGQTKPHTNFFLSHFFFHFEFWFDKF